MGKDGTRGQNLANGKQIVSATKQKITILVADDHPVVRKGLQSCLSRQDRLKIVGEAADGDEALRKTLELKPDVVLMDISMPRLNGLAVTETLRKARPDLVLTASPVDYLCDHEAASALVRDACFAAPAPNYSTRTLAPAPPLDRIPHLYFMDPIDGRDRDRRLVEPHFVVDIAPAFARKRAMLAEHASQRIWLRQHHGTDNYLDEMERWTRQRGALVGVEYGEGFRRYQGHAYPRDPLLEELLGPAAVPFAAAAVE